MVTKDQDENEIEIEDTECPTCGFQDPDPDEHKHCQICGALPNDPHDHSGASWL